MASAADIPLRNIWVLLLYAADLAQLRDQFKADVEAAADLPDLVGRILSKVVEERLRRNLSRGYRSKRAVVSRVRGRIDMLRTTSNQLLERGMVACVFDEHTMDTPRNRLVRAALDRLAASVTSAETAHMCRRLSAEFSHMGVSCRRPARAELATDQIGRNETADRIVVALASMVFDIVIPTEFAGENQLQLADTNEHLLRRIFEKAVGNALRIQMAGTDWDVRPGRRIKWPVEEQSSGLASILPGMQTDIEMHNQSLCRKIVIDTKFTHIFTTSQHRTDLLKSGYLYQLYAYLRTQERIEKPETINAEGMLLHPQVGGAVDEFMCIQGHRMRFKTIDLIGDTERLECQLRTIFPMEPLGLG
jgi:5-methylcytosine-specific restriction enzyme subunit McrC